MEMMMKPWKTKELAQPDLNLLIDLPDHQELQLEANNLRMKTLVRKQAKRECNSSQEMKTKTSKLEILRQVQADKDEYKHAEVQLKDSPLSQRRWKLTTIRRLTIFSQLKLELTMVVLAKIWADSSTD